MGVWVAILSVCIPLAAVVGKLIVQPLVAARSLPPHGGGARVEALERRVMMLEQSLEHTERTVERLREEADFLRQLAAPGREHVS